MHMLHVGGLRQRNLNQSATRKQKTSSDSYHGNSRTIASQLKMTKRSSPRQQELLPRRHYAVTNVGGILHDGTASDQMPQAHHRPQTIKTHNTTLAYQINSIKGLKIN